MLGTFTMYQNNDYNIEVQVKSFKCSTNAYCLCGVVVRVGQTVFMINQCAIDYWFIDYILCNDGGDILDVKKSDGVYKIMLPTGAFLNIDLRGSFLNVYMYPSVVDVGVSRGLCGNLTGLNYRQQNELVLRDGRETKDEESFHSSWKTRTGEDMFDPDNLDMLSAWSRNYTTCKCNKPLGGTVITEIDCSPNNLPDTCNEDEGFRAIHKKRCISPVRKKRSIPKIGLHPENHLRIKRVKYTLFCYKVCFSSASIIV
ncbi:hypothetical protein SNE40_008876 [Patella caerulea]|uniref:VWFD domain-containing protein n=1 Tax=Patella caerulea TaxID=87958 RepID=A0AAN8PWW1_PATCE